jgi:hypothetical protein
MWDSFYSYSWYSCYSWSNHWCNMQPCVRCHCNHRAIRCCLILGLPWSGRFTLGIESQPRQRSFFWTTNRSNQTNVGFSVFLFVSFVLFVVKPLVQHAAVCSLPLQPSGDSILFDPWATEIWSLHSGNRISAKTMLLFSTTNSSNHTNVGFILFLFVVFVLFVVKPLVQHAAVCSLPLQPSGDSMLFDPWATVIWSLHSGNRISAKTTLLFLDHE